MSAASVISGDEHGCELSYSRSARSAGSEAAGDRDHYWSRGQHYTHGTYYSYTHGACRCVLCREANRVACWRRRNGLGPGNPEPRGCGSTYAYNHGCRCEDCRAAKTAARRRHYNAPALT